MTTLTPNRILQQGDEYRNNGTWKPVPKEDYGLQVMFTKYAEVRRPAETPFVHGGAPAIKVEPISPDNVATPTRKTSEGNERGESNVKAEKEKTPAPTPSGAGAPSPRSYPDFAGEFEKAVKAAGLPTVISKKAHQDAIEHPEFVGHVERLTATHVTETEKAAEAAKVIAERCDAIKIDFPKISAGCGDTPSIWTGRNGTFTGYALEAHVLNENITLTPHGKRGSGNCLIQFPISVIPQLVDFLLRQQK